MSINLKRIETAQHFLERELVTKKLVSLVRRDPPFGQVNAGRYHFLWKAIQAYPHNTELLEAIVLLGHKRNQTPLDSIDKEADWPLNRRVSEWLVRARQTLDDQDILMPRGFTRKGTRDYLHLLEALAPIQHAALAHLNSEDTADLETKIHTLRHGVSEAIGRRDKFGMIEHFEQLCNLIDDVQRLQSEIRSESPVTRAANTDQPNQFEIRRDKFIRACATSDPAFLHGIALMHWEWALDFDQDSKEGNGNYTLVVHHYQRAHYYWTHLLGRQGYWQSLSKQYYQGKDALEDISAKLHRQVSQELLHHHYNRCRTSFNNGDLEAAIFHLKCLCNWNVKDETCIRMYDEPLLEQEWDQTALETVNKEAERTFNGWVSEWLAQANKALDDPNVDLPRGISKNYAGALDTVRLYLELVPGNPRSFQRLLLFILRQANGWCYEAAIAEDHKGALDVIENVQPAIEYLESLLTKPATNAPTTAENKTLSTTYWLKAQLVDGPELTAAYAKLAAEWDPGNREAGNLSAQMNVRIRMDQAQEYLEVKEFQKALEVLEDIDLEAYPDAQEPVHSLIAVTHFQWAMRCAELANQETEDLLEKGIIRDIEKTTQIRSAVRQLEQARDHMALALEYEPEHPVLTENLQALEHEVKYRPFGIKMRVGIEFFEKDVYDDALVALEGNFPKDFPGNDTVLQVRAGCFFRRAIQHANNERFDDAVEDMRQARDLVPDNETVQEQLAELEQIRRDFPYLKAMREAESLLEKEQYQDALDAMRNIPTSFGGYERVKSLKAVCEFQQGIRYANDRNFSKSVEHLERAAKLNPDESVIQEQLAIARHMLTDAPYIEAVREAQTLMGKERYEDALRAMRNIPRSFSDYQGVQRLKAVCEFNIGIQYTNAKNLSQAIKHLEQAAKYDPSESAIKRQLAELRQVQRLGGFAAIERRNRAFSTAQQVIQVLEAASPSNPLTPEIGYKLLDMLEQAVKDSDRDPQIVALRDQLASALRR